MISLKEKVEFWNKFSSIEYKYILEKNETLSALFEKDWNTLFDNTIIGPDKNAGILFINLFYKIANESERERDKA